MVLMWTDLYMSRVVSPELWEHICSLTQSVNEQKGGNTAVSEDSLHGRIKYLRRAYLLSVILFTTNSECCYPFHVQLADAVETPGGSSELVTILNHVGATASIYNPQTAHSNNLSEAS